MAIYRDEERLPPKYVSLSGIELILLNGEYYRHAGMWSVGYKFVEWDHEIVSVCSHTKSLDNIKLITITKEQWEEGNRGYI